MGELIVIAYNLGGTVVTLMVTYLIGAWLERWHYDEIKRREKALRGLAAVTFRRAPPTWTVEDAELCMGSVVISLDYFKRFLAMLRGFVGGRVSAYETLLDRARRESVLRLKEEAKRRGFDAVLNVRLETARLASTGRNGKGTTGVEVLAYGTAIKLATSANVKE